MFRRTIAMMSLVLLVGAAGLFALQGCSDDGAAPHDELTTSTQDMANQSGVTAFAMAKLSGEFLGFTPGKLDETNPEDGHQAYPLVLTGEINGTAYLFFKKAGEMVAYDADPDWAWLFTIEGAPLVSQDELIAVGLDLLADPLSSTSATVNGEITVWFGPFERTYTVTDVVVVLDGPPTGGTLTYSDDEHDVTVTYDGTDFAEIEVDGFFFELNLGTGEVVAMR